MFLTDEERRELSMLLEGTEWTMDSLTEKVTDERGRSITPGELEMELEKGLSGHIAFRIYRRIELGTPTANYSGHTNEYLVMFSLTQLPGCCGAVVSHSAYIAPGLRGRGIGTLMNKVRQRLGRASGYGIMICTDLSNNEPQQKILNRFGWKSIYEWINPRTKNALELRVLHLTDL